ncbi:YPDG domain-containing protein [Limosilactobacillus vaginalis]|uniref:YPDG domain-containing protein n=1 Tax=Limosilactobacillus vaginalis TaxID=1633 RepID=UPI0025A471A3|nr:YPDG domain-containing protein [Limosilactobacillus vaginalis]MDM8260116.1 YPDG domain-containing protein [Limosilactobacillus vaginalis]
MLSRNNWKEQVRQQEPKKQRFTIKKLTIGVASVLIGFTFMGMSASAHAQTTSNTDTPAVPNTPSSEGQSKIAKSGATGDAVSPAPAGKVQDTTTPAPSQQQTVNKWMSTPALDDLKNFEGTPENHVTKTDVTNVVNQINSLKQEEYQNQLKQVKQQVLNEIGKRLDTVTPAQIQAVKDEQDLFQLEGVLQGYSEHQDVIKQQELKNEISQIKAQGNKDVDAAKTNAEVKAVVKKTLDGLSLVVAKNYLWSTRGTLIRSGFLLNSYAYLSNEDKAALQKQITDAKALLAEQTTELDDWKQGDAAAFENTTKQTQKKASQILNEIKEAGTKNFAAAQSALAKLPNLHTDSPFAPAVLTAFQKEVKDAKNANTIDILMSMAKKMKLPIPKVKADTTTLIAPSKIVPSYDGTKVVDTPFYNNSRGTNSNLIDNQSKTGQYTFYFTAKDASGKEYASSYAAEKGNPTGVVLNSILDKDAGAYDPNSLEFHFYYQNNTDQDQTINYTLRMADYLNPYKAGRPESSLVPDGSRISDVKVTSKQGNTYDISSVTKTLDGVKSRDGDLRYVGDVPVNLTVKANDAINLVIPFVLNTTAKKSNTTIDDHNEFSVRENGQQTGYLVVRSSTYAPLYTEDKIYPEVNVGNNNYTHDYPDNPGPFDLDPSVYLDNDFMDGFWDGRTGVYKASKPTNLNTVYNSYTYSFLLLDNYQKSLTKHGFTVAFRNGKPVPYYMYQLSKTGAKVVDKNGNPVQGETKGLPYFEVVPVILLNQDENYTTKTAPTAWDPSTMVNKVADPTNYRYWDQKTDSAVRIDNTAAQLTANDFTVTITRDGKVVTPTPDTNGKYDLSKPGTYTVTYSKDFNGTTISNSGQITVTPAADTTVTYTFHDETDKPVEGHDVTVTGQPGTDQKVNLTTPEGYKLAEGQTLPTSVTMPEANETITIHLVHATKDNQKYEVNYVPMDIERPTTDTSVTKTQMPTVTNADTMPDGTITGYKQKTFDAPKGVTTSVDSKTGELTVTVEKDATTGPFLVPVDISYQDGRGMICYVPVKIHDKIDTNDQTVQISPSLTSPIVNLHRTTDDNTNIDVNNSRINTIKIDYDWDHTNGNGNYRKTIVYKLNTDGTKFVNTTDPTDSFDASGFKYEWRKGYAPNTKFGTGTGTVLAQSNGVYNPEAMFRMNYTITDPSVARKLNLPTNFSTYKTVFFNFWGATTGQPLTFKQNQDISNLSQAQYRQLIDVTDLGANGWNGTNVDPSTPQEAAYTPGTDTTKTFSMAWAPNGQPSTATVADGVKGTVRINFNDGTYLDVPATINVVKNNADQYMPAYNDTTVAANSSVDTDSPSFTKNSKPVTDVPRHTYAFNDGTTKMTINDKSGKNPVTVTINKTSGAITFTAPDDATEYDIPVTVTYKDGSSNTATAKVFVNKSLDPTKVDPTNSEYKEMFKTVTRDIVTTSVSGQQTTESQGLDFGRTMTIYGNGKPATYGKWEAGKLSADKFTTQGGSTEFASENITPVDGYTSYYKIGNNGQKVNASAVPSASALDKDGNPVDGTTVYVGYDKNNTPTPDDNKSNKPVTPTNPAKPDNGNKGTDTPVTPSKPTDNKGDQPTTPTKPNTGKDDNKGDQSTTPTNPSKGDDKPTNPTAPTNPSKPNTGKDDNNKGDQPTNPTTPTKPDDNKSNKPVTPTNPAKPDNGNKGTDTPVTPSKPTDNKGDQPTTPTIPAQPDHGNASISGQAGHKPATSDNGTQNGNNNGINNGTQNGNGNKTVNTNVTDNGNGDKTVNTNVTDNGNGDKTVNTNVTDNGNGDKQALPQTGNTKNDAAVAGLGLASLLAMLGLGGLKKKRN